jgi:hypothetical protein
MAHPAFEYTPFRITHRASGKRSFRLTQSARETCSAPMTRYAFEQPGTARLTVDSSHFSITIGQFKQEYLALMPVEITIRLLRIRSL